MEKNFKELGINMETMMDSLSDGLCIFNISKTAPYTEFVVWNKQMIEITGYTLEEINGYGWRLLMSGNESAYYDDASVNSLLNISDNKLHRNYEIVSKDGSVKTINVSISKMDISNEKLNLLFLVNDITEEKKKERELREIKERYLKILQLSDDAVFIHNNGKIIYANPRAYTLLGATDPEEILNKSMLTFVREDYHSLVMERIRLAMESEESMTIVEEVFLSVTGESIFVEVTATNIPFNGIKHNLVFVRDISERKEMERLIKENEAMLRRLTENTLDLISMCDKNGNITYATPSHLTVLGYKPEELVGRTTEEIIHPEYRDYFISCANQAIIENRSISIQWRCKCKNGDYKYLESFLKPIYADGNADGVVFSSRDLSERIEAEKALKKSEKKFKHLFNNVNDSIYLYKLNEDSIPGSFIEVNDIVCERLGYTREELGTMTVRDFNPHQSLEQIKETRETLLAKGQSMHRAINRTKSGKLIPVEVNSILLTLNDEKCVLSICRDITKREEAEKALRESEEKYRQLIESLPYAIFIRTRERMIFSNKTGLEYIGASTVEELESKSWADFIIPHPSYVDDLNRISEKIFTEGYLSPTEEKYIRLLDNKVLDVETIVSKCSYKDLDEAFLVVTRDISERRKAEELQKNMEEKSKQLDEVFEYEKLRTEFFANISHELRTPVNVIFSTLQLLSLNINTPTLIDTNDEKFKKHINTMRQNCYRLIRLINNLIDVTRIDAGFFDLNLSNNNIVSVVEDITLSVAEYIENKNIALIFDTDVEEKIIACDPDMIERIILNLISNAVKFTKQGGSITVKISDMSDSIIISVKDTGIGISEDKQKVIFERFIQVDKSLTRKREGSGIGLSLVKSLVEMHRGSIKVKSKPEVESEFIIKLPITLVDDKTSTIDVQRLSPQANIEKINIEFSDIY